MARHSCLDQLKPLDECAVQPYFSDRVQLADVIEWILEQIGQADISVSTFSTGEEFLRRLSRMKAGGLVGTCSLFCDLRAARKTVALRHFIRSVFDSVYLCSNHSKVVLLYNAVHAVAVVTSQNQTRGDRYECGVITTDPATFFDLRLGFDALSANSIPLDGLLSRDN